MIKISHMKRKLWPKIRFHFGNKGPNGKEDSSSLMRKPNVNEEYKEAFRTKSYIDIYNKVQGQLEIRTSLDEGQSSLSSSSSLSPLPPSSPWRHVHLSQYLLEPGQETLASILQTSDLHPLLVSYFENSLEASRTCEFLLQRTHQVHIHYRALKNVLKLIKRVPDKENWTHTQHHSVYRNLASFASHTNPFSTMTREKFQELHDSHVLLRHQLTYQCRKSRRRTKLIKCIKRALAIALVAGCGALSFVLLVLMIPSTMGLIAAPGLVLCSLALFKVKKLRRTFNKKRLDGLVAQLDVAARGVYIMMNEFDMMSILVQRLHDEMEHRRFVADICVKKGGSEMLREVLKEFQIQDSCFLEQLQELEKQIYLCFLDINRSRRLIVESCLKMEKNG